MGTLASQAEIGVTGPSTGQAASVGGGQGYLQRKSFEILHAKSCNLVRFGPENGSQQCRPYCVVKHFNNGNAVP